MTNLAVEQRDAGVNPINLVEEVALAGDWAFERIAEDELVAELKGRWCDHRLYFIWVPEVSALQFSCQFDMRVQGNRRAAVIELLAAVNARLWLGHFDLEPDEGTPMFRHAILTRGLRGVPREQVEELVSIAVAECERFYPAFQFVLWGGKSATDAMESAILDTAGEA